MRTRLVALADDGRVIAQDHHLPVNPGRAALLAIRFSPGAACAGAALYACSGTGVRCRHGQTGGMRQLLGRSPLHLVLGALLAVGLVVSATTATFTGGKQNAATSCTGYGFQPGFGYGYGFDSQFGYGCASTTTTSPRPPANGYCLVANDG